MIMEFIDIDGPVRPTPGSREIVPGTFAGGEIEPGVFHAAILTPSWVDDRDDVNPPLLQFLTGPSA
jgi:hypothetical protein